MTEGVSLVAGSATPKPGKYEGNTDVEEREVSYPVKVTLSRVRKCGNNRYD